MVTTLDDETPRLAAIFHAAKKHTVAATLCREETHRSSDFMSRRNTS
ncbi:hypothetical protein [Pseudoalteromonas sp. HM-SA03]|nr:hypothetical protein [Pseudoalteromonas sp. HM-SA03]